LKKFIIVVLVVFLVLGLLACAAPGEKIMEKMFEEAAEDENVDVDMDGDGGSISIQGEDGDVEFQGSGDGMPWPSDLPDFVAEPQGVTVTSKMKVDTGGWVMFEDCDQNEKEAYVSYMKGLGWEQTIEMEQSDGYQLMVTDQATGRMLQFAWYDDGTGQLTYGEEE